MGQLAFPLESTIRLLRCVASVGLMACPGAAFPADAGPDRDPGESSAPLYLHSTISTSQPMTAAKPENETTPPESAKAVTMTGVPNLYQVAPGLYRSAQPTASGFKNLRGHGVETIVNLRSFHSDRREIAGTGLAYEHIYMKAWHPEWHEAVRFLQIVTNERRSPVLVHCMHGSDRTGAMIALYRIAVQGWTREEAIAEMTDPKFGFHPVWKNLVSWLNSIDINRLRREAGIPDPKRQNLTTSGTK